MTKTQSNEIVTRAAEYAEVAHASIDQRRKYTGAPYIVHPAEVARVVGTVTDDPVTIATAWLHDVVEDTPVTLEDIRGECGSEIAALVSDLTNVSRKSDGNRAVRKQLDRQHTAEADPRAKTVKLADIIHNATDIASHDPSFARVYLEEKELALKVLGEGDARLFRQATTLISRLQADLQP